MPLFLEGRWVEGATEQVIRSPHDGAEVGRAGFASGAQVDRAIAFAHQRAADVARVPLYRRADVLGRVADLLKARLEDVARTICGEAGKPMALARAEAQRGVETFQCAEAEARRMDGEALPLDTLPRGEGRFGVVRRFPVGPVAAVSPFNFPLNLVAHKVAPAMAAGCPVVLKPASQTPLTAYLLAHLCEEAGLVEGGLQVVPAGRRDADLLVTDDRVRLLSFTGSPAVGWDMKARAGRKKVVLELGGNAGVILLPDADVTAALPALAAGAFAYAGQVCISVQRILVPDGKRQEFAEAFGAHVQASVKTGDPARDDVLNGPLIDEPNARRVLEWIAEARAAGARVVTGGERAGNAVTPAVLADVPPDARAYAEEAFGPLVCVEGYASVDDAAARLNRGRFGLQAGVYTNDLKALWRLYDRLEVGGVIHNDVPTFRVDQMPYGGVKDSGLGREGIRYALEDLTERRLLVLRP
ncbi:MAG: aldehyde dehydrogenase family protein [Deltaproteobacteria bacterium]|nr:aldehyde dehydrogenase family protein [Deltaproteobacteria bacterium]